jgi:predicted RecB family nuclease
MKSLEITEELLCAYLKCESKFYLKAIGKVGTDATFSSWQRQISEDYKRQGSKRLVSRHDANKCYKGTPSVSEFKTKKYCLIIEPILDVDGIKSHIHALERVACCSSRKLRTYIPIRFVPAERISKLDKLLLAFDGIALSKHLGEDPVSGKIIHGARSAHMKIRLSKLTDIVTKSLDKMALQYLGTKPPEIVLNRHCGECEYSSLCRHIAAEKDDLSLLSNLTEKERRKLHNKGIFTVTQLSYTFRPRRRPKRMASERPKYYHSLKALAIREQKTYLVGRPELQIKGTPVYVDVESVPHRDFFYLIGLRFMNSDRYIQQHFWADGKQDERLVWHSFLDILPRIDSPVLVHYGSFETTFLRRMKARYGYGDSNHDLLERWIMGSLNVLCVIYGQVYFPTYSNSLKDVAKTLGYRWSENDASGTNCMLWRQQWEQTRDSSIKQKIMTYNAEDCKALEIVTHGVQRFCQYSLGNRECPDNKVVDADCMTPENPFRLGRNKFVTPALKDINRCAYWDYQRNKVYVKSSRRLKQICQRPKLIQTGKPPVNKVVEWPAPRNCPKCAAINFTTFQRKTKIASGS